MSILEVSTRFCPGTRNEVEILPTFDLITDDEIGHARGIIVDVGHSIIAIAVPGQSRMDDAEGALPQAEMT